MKKLLILLFSILISFNSYGEWTLISESETGDTFYIDKDSIRKHNGFVYWWDMGNRLEPSDTGTFSIEYYAKGDCGMFRQKTLSYIFYKQPMGKGENSSLNDEQPWDYPSPGSIGQIILDYVCDYVD